MKIAKATIAALCLTSIAPTLAAEPNDAAKIGDVILVRPVGVAATVAGTAAFIGLSPLTAIAAIAEPHDAFEQMADIMIMKPARFTFQRPLGEWDVNGK